MSLSAAVESGDSARETAIASLQELLGDRLSRAASVLEQHGKDASYHPCAPPDAVDFARSTEKVSEIVKLCARHRGPDYSVWHWHRLGGQCRGIKGRGVLYPNEPKEMAEAERLNDRLVHRALSLDGTCTGEHGIGWGKMDFLIAEHGEAVNVMRAIKQAIDPDNIVNPGKILRI